MFHMIYLFIFALALLKYCFYLHIFFHAKLERWKAFVAFTVFCAFMIWLIPIENSSILIVLNIGALATITLSYGNRSKKRLANIIYSFIILTCIDAITERINELVIHNSYSIIVNYLIDSIAICLVFGLIYICSKISNKKEKKELSNYFEMIVIGMIINILLTIAGIHILLKEVTNTRLTLFFQIMSILSYLTVVCLIMFIVYIDKTKNNISESLSFQIQLKQMQESYYLSLLQKEEDTRKSRHDWNNHMLCLRELAVRENYSGIVEYINQMLEDVNALKKRQFEFGNEIVNVIINYYLSNISKDIIVSTKGYFTSDILVNESDLCIIVSNLIKNAVEYLEKNDIPEKLLHIKIDSGNHFQRIIIQNSVAKDFSLGSTKYTSKEDQRNHGFGIRNVVDTVERNEGVIEFALEDGVYSTKVVLRKQ